MVSGLSLILMKGTDRPLSAGAGACVQIFLFSVAAIELKRKAPGAHTFLDRTYHGDSADDE